MIPNYEIPTGALVSYGGDWQSVAAEEVWRDVDGSGRLRPTFTGRAWRPDQRGSHVGMLRVGRASEGGEWTFGILHPDTAALVYGQAVIQ